MRRFSLFFLFFFLNACVTDPVSRNHASPTPVILTQSELADAINREGFLAYSENLSVVINPLEVYTSKTSAGFKALEKEIEDESHRAKNTKNIWSGSFESDEQLPSEAQFTGKERSMLANFSKVWSDKYYETDTYRFMEISYANSRMVADVFFPKDDFENFTTQFTYDIFQEAMTRAKTLRAKVFVPGFAQGTVNKMTVLNRGSESRSIECGTFPEVSLNRPFIFIIRDPKTDVILFMANVSNV